MNEIEKSNEIVKLYGRAGVEPLSITICGIGEQLIEYPKFTFLKIIKILWLIGYKRIFAFIISQMLKDLIFEEKEQIRGILNG